MRWNPRTSGTDRCQKCGNHVTPEFRRGYGDRRDRAHRCPGWNTVRSLGHRGAVGNEVVSPFPRLFY
ncbi:hypothetical protein EA462_05575 [Natrarchaeobius halalkaliphilus]|uniref:Uncharacterized protein n=1 Tax=Natrarchaeobius halalkaliphilus TaxID=1679091 RepID=A0A3N6LPL6_9EURY|nr:hypothetical protein EA462_05575 [Natrarchaeobius halalkaliphilus]